MYWPPICLHAKKPPSLLFVFHNCISLPFTLFLPFSILVSPQIKSAHVIGSKPYFILPIGLLRCSSPKEFQYYSQLSVDLGRFSHASSLAICAIQPFLTALAVIYASFSLCYLWCSAISHVTFCRFSESVWIAKLPARAAYLNTQHQPFHFMVLLFLNDIA